jgi:DNA-binding transcriptional LysR family regulator
MHSRRADLNLLAVLDVLLAEKNVSRAADRLHLSQPAVSHALARAREMLDDPLLLREGGRMIPTPKAVRLQQPLREVLSALEALLYDPGGFDPSRVHETIQLGLTDYSDFVLMPTLVERLRSEAPEIRCVTHNVQSDQLHDMLSVGRLDMAVIFGTADRPALNEAALFEEGYMCLASSKFRGQLTLERYLAADHVQVSYSGSLQGAPDEALGKAGLKRNVVFVTPHFMAAAAAVESSQLLMTTPATVAKRLVRDLPLKLFTPPFELPHIKLRLVWHPRTHQDPVRVWIRQALQDAAAAI